MFVLDLGMVIADDECIIVVRRQVVSNTSSVGTERSCPATHSRSENSNLAAFPICECPLAMSHHCGFARWT